ncbi:hypothetical protein MTO96_012213 [Rhipicephalus appendiculatus]
MIAAGEPLEFVPYGTEYLTHHPGNVRHCSDGGSSGDRVGPTSAAELSEALRGVSLRINKRSEDGSQQAKTSFWKLRESPSREDDDSDGEEEIYSSSNTVVWSKSNGGDVRTVLRTFNISGKIQDALWCEFLVADYQARHLFGSASASETETRVPCVCIFEESSGTLHCFSRSGEDYTRSVPFVVSRLWPMRYGLLIERRSRDVADQATSHFPPATPNEHSAAGAMMFSLLHPLDEVAPVVSRTAVHGHVPRFGYMQCGSGVEVVYVCEEPSLLVMFHRSQASHSVWEVRRTTDEEDQYVDTSAVAYNLDRTPSFFRAAAVSSSPAAGSSFGCSPRRSHGSPANGRSALDRDLKLRPPQPLTPRAHGVPEQIAVAVAQRNAPLHSEPRDHV